MKTTEYLFGKNREDYGPCITELATQRVEDAKAVLKKLSRQRDMIGADMKALTARYLAVEKAKVFWQQILEEE